MQHWGDNLKPEDHDAFQHATSAFLEQLSLVTKLADRFANAEHGTASRVPLIALRG